MEEFVADYGAPLAVINDVQAFNPGDGVDTRHVFNTNFEGMIDQANYCLIQDQVDGHIVSRWYILDQDYTRPTQTVLTLHRDVIADNVEAILNAPAFVEKATVADGSAFIFNSEAISVNQIKKSETLLKDETGIAWIVGYLDNKYPTGTGPFAPINIQADIIPDESLSALSDYDFNEYVGRMMRDFNSYVIRVSSHFSYSAGGSSYTGQIYNLRFDGSDSRWKWEGQYPQQINNELNLLQGRTQGRLTRDAAFSAVTNPDDYTDLDTIADIRAQQDRIIKVGTTAYKANSYNQQGQTFRYPLTSSDPLYATILSIFTAGLTVDSITVEIRSFASARLTLPIASFGSYSMPVPLPEGRLHLKDAPYDMFCIPCGDVRIKNTVGTTFDVTVDRSLAISIGQGLAKALGSFLYDMQILPYCPMSGFQIEDDVIDIHTTDSKRFTMISSSTANVIPVLWSTASSGSKTINFEFPIDNLKISNQSDMMRICSPNYNGVFEFTPAKNRGVSGFIVDYTYLPFSPYVHVSPIFSDDGLYGGNYGDARGLVCQGDFSIGYMSDAWIQYQIQNKNLYNTFNREVQNMEVNNAIARQNGIWSAVAGSLSTGMSGSVTGSAVGGIPGAFAGAAFGTVAGAAGAAVDYRNMVKLQEEALDFKKDQFNFALDNIRALPNSIAKTTAFTVNNKFFPFIEVYSCTEEEKRAIAQKIRHNGMTVGAIGTLNEYINNEWEYDGIKDRGYFKARIIDVSDLNCDFHMAASVAEELMKGIYTK